MSKLETAKEFCDRVPRELGLADFNSFEARRHLEGRLIERDAAVAEFAMLAFHVAEPRCEWGEGGCVSDSTMLGRLGYVRAIRYAPTSFLGLLRMLWSDYVLHVLLDKGTETCEDCGSWRFQLWSSPDDLWLEASPSGGPCGLLCLHCFSARLRERGVIVGFNACVLRRKGTT